MRPTQAQINAFQKEILDWYKKNKRDLPWRKDRDPYHVLVSEVMLQQTQVQRVIPKYENWLMVFPDVASLAKASTRDVLLHWSGLGYNRRALYLQKLAKVLVYSSREAKPNREVSSRLRWNNNSSASVREEIVWPQTEKELRTLPGIGEYTSRALLCFALDHQVAVVDTNIRKVIAVKFFNSALPEEKVIQQIAQDLLPKGKAYEWNQALMDYAAVMLKEYKIPIPKQPKFKGSDRFFRGLIIRILLSCNKLYWEELYTQIEHVHTIEQKRLQKILQKMNKDGLVVMKRGVFMLTMPIEK